MGQENHNNTHYTRWIYITYSCLCVRPLTKGKSLLQLMVSCGFSQLPADTQVAFCVNAMPPPENIQVYQHNDIYTTQIDTIEANRVYATKRLNNLFTTFNVYEVFFHLLSKIYVSVNTYT